MYFPVSKAEGRQTVVIVEKVLSLFLFVEFEIIGGNAGWMRVEKAWIQTAGYAFRIAAAGNFCDLKRNLVKQKPWMQALGFSMELSERNVSFQ